MIIHPKEATSLRSISILTLAIVTLQLFSTIQLGTTQATDGDEQFQVYHQDIGRISGGQASGGSHVAANTVVRQFNPTTSSPLSSFERTPASSSRARQAQQPAPRRSTSSASQQQHSSRSQHQPQVTSRARTVISQQPPAVDQQLAAHTEPSSFSQLVAPPRLLSPQHSQQLRSHFQQPTTTAQAFQPMLAESQAEHPSNQQPLLQSAPLRAQGHSLSVSARHAALMAQVAAERQTAASAEQPILNSEPSSTGQLFASQPSASATQFQQQLPSLQAAASPALTFVNQPEEPLVAPSFEHVLQSGCPHKGLFSYPNKDHCDRYYMCTNGTFTEEACPNGLAYSQLGAVYQHCAYQWNVDCARKKTAEPISSPGCPWQFGIFPIVAAGKCSIDYFVCEWGVPETKRCTPEGLFYDDRIKGCQWADQLGCKSEALLNFKCPPEDEDNPYWPYPRYYHTKQDVVVCVNEQPRLVHCNEDQTVEPSSLACVDLKKKKKMKF